MQHTPDHNFWRTSFCSGLRLIAQAVARLPYGAAEPILCGTSALELYTGRSWDAADLVLLISDQRPLNTELMQEGFRWVEHPKTGGRGLWHPTLQIGVHLIDLPLGAAELLNILTVHLDAGCSTWPGMDGLLIRVVGIEDLIAAQVTNWVSPESAGSEVAGRVGTLTQLARAGVGGRLRAGYLRRRLVHETNGTTGLDSTTLEGGYEELVPRSMSLVQMQAIIEAWRLRCGLSFGARSALLKRASGGATATRSTREIRQGRTNSSMAANVIPLDGGFTLVR